MVRCLTKRKRGCDLTPHTVDENASSITTRKNAKTAHQIGWESPIKDDLSNRRAKVCSIRDDHESTDCQSSILSFFKKETKAKTKQTTKHTNDDMKKRVFIRSAETKRALSTSLSSPSINRITERPSMKAKALSSRLDRTSSKRKSKHLTQVYIDCGQSKFGQILCSKCGMLYMPGIPEDEIEHNRLCQAFSLGIPCNRGNVKGGKRIDFLKNENEINFNNVANIVVWRPCAKAQNSKKYKGNNEVESNFNSPTQWPLLARMISKDLGTSEETILDHLTNEIVFLYIGKNYGTKSKNYASTKTTNAIGKYRILGAATVRSLGQVHAYRMISLYERSLTPVKEAKLGISLLWTHPVARNKGIATKLVDAACEQAVFGMRVAREDVAFSSPTQAGYNFALQYCNGEKNMSIDRGISSTAQRKDGRDHSNGSKIEGSLTDPEKQQKQVNSSCSRARGPLVYEINL